jgi:hypothetical protein
VLEQSLAVDPIAGGGVLPAPVALRADTACLEPLADLLLELVDRNGLQVSTLRVVDCLSARFWYVRQEDSPAALQPPFVSRSMPPNKGHEAWPGPARKDVEAEGKRLQHE